MRELIGFADVYLNYRRGKEAGLAGLIGFVLLGLCIYFWDYISAFFNFIGLTAFLREHGFIAEEAGITALRIFMGWLFLCLVMAAVIAIGLVFMFLVFMIGRNSLAMKLIKFLFKWSFYILFSPIIILYNIYKSILRAKAGEMNIGNLLAEKNQEITLDEAKEILNRLPHPDGKDDEPLIVAVDYRQDVWVLFPRVEGFSMPDTFEGEKLKVETEFSGITGKYDIKSIDLDFSRFPENWAIRHSTRFKPLNTSYMYPLEQKMYLFERFFLPKDEKLRRAVDQAKKQIYYENYAMTLVKGFFTWKEKHLLMLEDDTTPKEDYEKALRVVYQYVPRNQDEMQIAYETELRQRAANFVPRYM
jgi:hypothetical protein